jgi:hypothetical protein
VVGPNDPEAHRTGGAVAGQPNHPDIQGKELAPELGATTVVMGTVQHLFLKVYVLKT